MGFRYHKRIGSSKGWGLNVSGSGISPSYRTQYGSISPKGFSIRTGIPGLSYRSGFGGKRGKNSFGAFLITILLFGAIILSALIIWNILLFIKWVIIETYHVILRIVRNYKLKRELRQYQNTDDIRYNQFTNEGIPEFLWTHKFILTDILVDEQTIYDVDTNIATIEVLGQKAKMLNNHKGKVIFLKNKGDEIKFGEVIYKVILDKS